MVVLLLRPLEVVVLLLRPLEVVVLLLRPLEVVVFFLRPLEVVVFFLRPLEVVVLFLRPLEVVVLFLRPLEVVVLLLRALEVVDLLLRPLEVVVLFLRPLVVVVLFLRPLEVVVLFLRPLEVVVLLLRALEVVFSVLQLPASPAPLCGRQETRFPFNLQVAFLHHWHLTTLPCPRAFLLASLLRECLFLQLLHPLRHWVVLLCGSLGTHLQPRPSIVVGLLEHPPPPPCILPCLGVHLEAFPLLLWGSSDLHPALALLQLW